MDWLIFAIIYLIGFARELAYVLRHVPAEDRFAEYFAFLYVVRKRNWRQVKHHKILASCVTAIILPYLVWRVTRWTPIIARLDAINMFRITPIFFYAMMPAFTYLIARLYLDIPSSIIACVFMLINFSFLYWRDMGRVSIGIGCLAGMLWSLLAGHTAISMIFAILIVISHYGTAYYSLFVLGVVWITWVFTDSSVPELRAVSSVLATLAVGIIVLYEIVLRKIGDSCRSFAIVTTTLSTEMVDKRLPELVPFSAELRATGGKIGKGITFRLPKFPRLKIKPGTKLHVLFGLEYRDAVIQALFGRTLRYMNTPQRVEWALTWVIILVLTAGLFLSPFTSLLHLAVAGVAYSTIVLMIALPHISIGYGSIRVYFTALIVLAPCFAVGLNELSSLIGLNQYVLPSLLVIFYGLTVSGWLHSLFGIEKGRKKRLEYESLWIPKTRGLHEQFNIKGHGPKGS